MRIKSSIMIGVLVSVMTLCAAFADSVVTSKSYVDAQDALKQNKIPVSGTNHGELGNSIITYTNAAGRIGERGLITDPDMLYDMTDGHIEHPGSPAIPTAGAVSTILQGLGTRLGQVEEIANSVTNFQTKIPNPGSGMLVVYDGVDEDYQTQFTGKYVRNQFDCGYIDGQGCSAEYNETDIPNMNAVAMILDELYSAVQEDQGALLNNIQSGTPGAIVTYDGEGAYFGERAILDRQYYDAVDNSDNIPTAGAVAAAIQTIGNQPISVMECANADCTLWNISQRTVLSPNNDAPYSSSAFVHPHNYTGYTPYNP